MGTPVFFDAFLFDNGGQPAQDFTGFLLWNVTGGSVDLVGGRVPGANDPTNGRYVDLDGGTAGRFSTKAAIPLVAGRTYRLSFTYLSTDGNANAATVTLGSRSFQVNTSSRTMQTFSRDFTVDATTTAVLAFQDVGNDDAGIGIDNVQVATVL